MSTKLRLAGVIRQSIVDGPGWRFTIFSQGCYHNCEGCHNPQTHDPNGGYISDSENLIAAIKENPLLTGVTFSGGEPFLQAHEFAELGNQIKEQTGLNIMTYTGYTFEQLVAGLDEDNGWRELLAVTDYLVDGPFILAQRSLGLLFRGSKNQRILDSKKSLEQGIPVEVDIQNEKWKLDF